MAETLQERLEYEMGLDAISYARMHGLAVHAAENLGDQIEERIEKVRMATQEERDRLTLLEEIHKQLRNPSSSNGENILEHFGFVGVAVGVNHADVGRAIGDHYGLLGYGLLHIAPASSDKVMYVFGGLKDDLKVDVGLESPCEQRILYVKVSGDAHF